VRNRYVLYFSPYLPPLVINSARQSTLDGMPDGTVWDLARATRQYQEGWTLRQLAAEAGLQPNTVRRRLLKAGVAMRCRGVVRRGPSTEALVLLRRDGLTYGDIAQRVGMSESGVRGRLKLAPALPEEIEVA
jgi:AraC-like DNA-binding protein